MNLDSEDIQAIAGEVARIAARPVLATPKWIAANYGCSAQTVRRKRKELGIPWRDEHGQPTADGYRGLKLIALSDWEAKEETSARSVKNDLMRRGVKIAS